MTYRPAPIALFVFARPDHLRRTLGALGRNHLAQESDLMVFADAPSRIEERAAVEQVREICINARGFRTVRLVERPEHYGLSRNVIGGVTEVCGEYGHVIVLEDDLVTSPWFLTYANNGLRCFEHEQKVASIHGYVYPVRQSLPETFFLRGADCWGWATWQRAWQRFNPDGASLLRRLEALDARRSFDFNDRFPFSRILEDQVAGRNDSWAIRWHASAFLENMFTLYPGRSLIQTIGHDGTGRHGEVSQRFDVALSEKPIHVGPVPVADSTVARSAFEEYFRESVPQRSWLRRVIRPRQVWQTLLKSTGAR